VRALIDAGAWIDAQVTTTGHTALIEAIWFHSDAIVDYLLAHDARIELKTYYAFTIDDHIDYAIKASKGEHAQAALARIKALVQRRRACDLEALQKASLIAAVKARDLVAVKAAISAGAPLEERHPVVGSFDDGHTSLLIAARDGIEDIVVELIAAGADVNAVEPVFGAVPLHKATYNGHLEITRRLAAAPNVNLNYQGPSNGYTPLHDALWHAYPECAEVLLDARARVDLVAYDGKLPIDIAIQELGESHRVVARLRELAASGRPK
jgi:ankyrin repeat protein